jgi:hypothetical protein
MKKKLLPSLLWAILASSADNSKAQSANQTLFSLINQAITRRFIHIVLAISFGVISCKKDTVPEYVGATDWQEFEMRGDTLVFKLFSKVIDADGKDITNQWPKIVEKRVKAKK